MRKERGRDSRREALSKRVPQEGEGRHSGTSRRKGRYRRRDTSAEDVTYLICRAAVLNSKAGLGQGPGGAVPVLLPDAPVNSGSALPHSAPNASALPSYRIALPAQSGCGCRPNVRCLTPPPV